MAIPISTFKQKQRVVTDHTNMIFGPFSDGTAVTRACLECHPEPGEEFILTQHWQWLGDEVKVSGHEQPMKIGKKNLLNNFCIGVKDNNQKCMSCHAGYGWKDDSFDFSDQKNIDCLVCHDQSGQYAKGDFGYPAKGVDLAVAAKSVGTPGRNNCGACHFNGGGGNGVKHGDLDNSLSYPTERIDVHMSKFEMICVDCHKTEHHQVAGRSMGVSVDDKNRVLCTDCHVQDLHKDERINAHTSTVACNSCHIPKFALDDPTKMKWDWSTAGQDLDIKDSHVYLKIKGHFTYQTDVVPEYYWYNGKSDRYIIGDKIDPTQSTYINYPRGNIHDRTARVSPFKIHWAKQPFDKKNEYLLSPTTAGEGGYWHEFNWDKALKLGSEAVGIPYSGVYGFAPTEMFWKISHMVAPKQEALQCVNCHGEGGRMDWKMLGYEGDPIKRGDRKRLGLLDATKNNRAMGGQNEEI
ncbi:tetrathionate reductase family octaheme c-type cytochrome [bacterium]|nr:tetrathionate reductase family octaheme c-type cytochrome [bacterium]